MRFRGSLCVHQPLDPFECVHRAEGSEGILHTNRRSLVLCIGAPHEDISYPIDTKNPDIHGRLDLKPTDRLDSIVGKFHPTTVRKPSITCQGHGKRKLPTLRHRMRRRRGGS